MTDDPFSRKHAKDEIVNNQKTAQDALARRQAAAKQKAADAQKPKFNDIPPYKPKWAFG